MLVGLGLSLVSDTSGRPGGHAFQDKKAKISRPTGQDFGSSQHGWGGGAGPAKFWLLGEGKSEDSLWRRDLSALGPFGAEAN